MKKILLFILCPFFLFAQTQIGSDIIGKLVGSNNKRVVSLSGNGNVVAVGYEFDSGIFGSSGVVRIFENSTGSWQKIGDDIEGEAAGDRSGSKISLNFDGSIIAIGAIWNDGNGNASGHVRIFKNELGVWTQIGSDIDGEAAGDLFGYSVSLSNDGNIVAIGGNANDGNGIRSGHVRVYRNESGIWTQIGSDIDGEEEGDSSGGSVSLSSSGNIVAIGANSNSTNGELSAEVRIYQNLGSVWTQIGDDINNGDLVGDRSGKSVCLSSDGNVLAIGVPNNDGNGSSSGQVRVYKNESEIWTQIGASINGEAIGDFSGFSIDLSSTGNIIAIGALFNEGIGYQGNGHISGHVRVYENINEVWTQIGGDIDGEAIVNVSGDRTGYSVSLSSDGSVVAVGAPNYDEKGFITGQVRIYENQSGIWTQIGEDINGDSIYNEFGSSVSLSSDGNIVAIGAIGNENYKGEVRVFQNVSGTWTQVGEDINGVISGDNFGYSLSLNSDGSLVAIGAAYSDGNGIDSGQVSIYENIGGVWTQIGTDINGASAGDKFGYSLSLSSDGSFVVIGAPNNDGNGIDSGNVRVYKNEFGEWTQFGDDIDGDAPGDQLGYSVSFNSDGSSLAVGAPFNNGLAFNTGLTRVYDLANVLSNKNYEKQDFKIYPNPVSSILNIKVGNFELKKVVIYNKLGQKMISTNSSEINVDGLSSGLYIIEVLTEKGKSIKRILVE